jgi:2,3-bisphosphoglycerate-independent phosphoglycerate mutase
MISTFIEAVSEDS